MPLDLLNLLLVMIAALAGGRVAARFKLPAVLGEILIGIALGPPLLGLLYGTDALAVLAELGVVLMMLYVGMEIDPKELKKASWAGLLAAVGGFVVPFGMCYAVVVWFGGGHMAGLFVGIAAGVTSLATKSRILTDLRLLDTRIAHVLMAGALVADTLSLLAFAAILGVVDAGGLDATSLAVTGAKAVAFFAACFAFGRFAIALLPALQRRFGSSRTSHFTLVLLIAVGFGELAELAGLHAILGAFIAGLWLRESALGVELARELRGAVKDISLGFLAPLFFVTAGFAVSLDILHGDQLALLILLLAAATIGKIIGTAVFYLPSGHGWREGLVVGTGMNGRGAVEIILAGIALQQGLIDADTFSMLVFMAIFTSATVPVLLSWGARWLRGRGELVRLGREREGTIIGGAGPLARMVARTLAPSGAVTLVTDEPRDAVDAESVGLAVVRGSPLAETTLAAAGAGEAAAFVSLTGDRSVDLLAVQLARRMFDVPEAHAPRATSDDTTGAAHAHVEATELFAGPAAIERWNERIAAGVAAMRVVPISSDWDARSLYAALQGLQPSLPVAIRRDGAVAPLHAGSALRAGDEVLALSASAPATGGDAFDRAIERCVVLDLDRPMAAPELFAQIGAAWCNALDRPAEIVSEELSARESASSTVLVPGLAVPHIMLDGANAFEVLVVRCRDGVAFPGADEPVTCAVALASTRDRRTDHLRALSAIAHIVQGAGFEREWRDATSVEELRQLVRTAERRRYPSHLEHMLAIHAP